MRRNKPKIDREHIAECIARQDPVVVYERMKRANAIAERIDLHLRQTCPEINLSVFGIDTGEKIRIIVRPKKKGGIGELYIREIDPD